MTLLREAWRWLISSFYSRPWLWAVQPFAPTATVRQPVCVAWSGGGSYSALWSVQTLLFHLCWLIFSPKTLCQRLSNDFQTPTFRSLNESHDSPINGPVSCITVPVWNSMYTCILASRLDFKCSCMVLGCCKSGWQLCCCTQEIYSLQTMGKQRKGGQWGGQLLLMGMMASCLLCGSDRFQLIILLLTDINPLARKQTFPLQTIKTEDKPLN